MRVMSSCGCSESYPWCGCWSSNGRSELKLYRAFIFCVPILFTLILLFLFYLFYLRPRPRSPTPTPSPSPSPTRLHNLGLKKELRDMLPIILYKQTFSVKDTQCSVCLLDYQADDRLQQIPACGHTFHMNCIDLWLSTHTTCPLCRFSLLSTHSSYMHISNNEETHAMEFSESRSTRNLETTVLQNVSGEVAISTHCIDVEGQNVQNNQ